MTNNISNKQVIHFQEPQLQADRTVVTEAKFANRKICLVPNEKAELSKEQSAQRLQHLLHARFPEAAQKQIDALFSPLSDNLAVQSLKQKQVKIV